MGQNSSVFSIDSGNYNSSCERNASSFLFNSWNDTKNQNKSGSICSIFDKPSDYASNEHISSESKKSPVTDIHDLFQDLAINSPQDDCDIFNNYRTNNRDLNLNF